MQVAIVRKYGGPEVVELAKAEVPTPKPGELLVRVTAVAVTAGDNRLRSGVFPKGFGPIAKLGVGFRGPRKSVLGIAYAGVVERLGEGVTEFAEGDRVAGVNGKTLGMHAEYATVPVSRATKIPEGVAPAQAVGALFGGTTALFFLRDKARVQPGHRVLVNGAAGSVGSAAVQLAKLFGAHVTAVTSGQNEEFVKRLGADEVINYEYTPVESLCSGAAVSGAHTVSGADTDSLPGEQAPSKFDVVLDTVGNIDRKLGLALATNAAVVVLIAADLAGTLGARGRVVAGVAPERAADFAYLLRLVADGQFDPVVTSVGGLEQIEEAHRVAASGHKVGNVVVEPCSEMAATKAAGGSAL
ncbi:MAG: NAD(P)-dependent alcohol dehydrogenase [Leucobacter sp.]|nr:NAD(P)-dependent alcohol dehydrogenase [Leucobacter sp.]